MSRIVDAPRLTGVVGLAEASEMLGISRQHCWRLASRGQFESLCQIGTKPLFVVKVEEVEDLRARRAEAMLQLSPPTQ